MHFTASRQVNHWQLPPIVTNTQATHHDWRPALTPVSPTRRITDIVAEKHTQDGVMYKVVWQDSWVHAARLPHAEMIRNVQYRRYARCWDVVG